MLNDSPFADFSIDMLVLLFFPGSNFDPKHLIGQNLGESVGILAQINQCLWEISE